MIEAARKLPGKSRAPTALDMNGLRRYCFAPENRGEKGGIGMTDGRRLGMRCLVAALIAPMLASCGGGVIRPTNPAVQACEAAADKQGFDVIDQQTVTPIDQGRYRVDLAVSDDKGDRRITCEWDAAGGARIGDIR
jgi:hypothetical protein